MYQINIYIKPVYYKESKDDFALKDLIDEKGTIVAKSQTFDSNGKSVKNSDGTFKTTAGIWDYGFAPILRYQEHEVARRKIKRDVISVSQGVEGASGVILSVEQVDCDSVPIYDVYEVTDHYESYIEEELPQYVGEPSTEKIIGSKYFRDYRSSYSNYLPAKLPSKLDFKVLLKYVHSGINITIINYIYKSINYNILNI